MKRFTFFLLTVLLFLGLQFAQAQSGGGKRPIPDGPQNATSGLKVSTTSTISCVGVNQIHFDIALSSVPDNALTDNAEVTFLVTHYGENGLEVSDFTDNITPGTTGSTTVSYGDMDGVDQNSAETYQIVVSTTGSGSFYIGHPEAGRFTLEITLTYSDGDNDPEDAVISGQGEAYVYAKPTFNFVSTALDTPLPNVVCLNDYAEGGVVINMPSNHFSTTQNPFKKWDVLISGDGLEENVVADATTSLNFDNIELKTLAANGAAVGTNNVGITLDNLYAEQIINGETVSVSIHQASCAASANKTFEIVEGMEITIGASRLALCESDIEENTFITFYASNIHTSVAGQPATFELLKDSSVVYTGSITELTTGAISRNVKDYLTLGANTFQVRISPNNGFCAATSEAIIINVLENPTITDIDDFYLCNTSGSDATVTPIINGWGANHGTKSYQWYKDGGEDPNSTTATINHRNIKGDYVLPTGLGTIPFGFKVYDEETGCNARVDFSVTTFAATPEIAPITFESPVCVNYQQTLTLTEQLPDTFPTTWEKVYKWSHDGGSSVTLTSTDAAATSFKNTDAETVEVIAALTYRSPETLTGGVVYNDIDACVVQDVIDITTVTPPTIDITKVTARYKDASTDNILAGVVVGGNDNIYICEDAERIAYTFSANNLIVGQRYAIFNPAGNSIHFFTALALQPYVYEHVMASYATGVSTGTFTIKSVDGTTPSLNCEGTTTITVNKLTPPTVTGIDDFYLCNATNSKATVTPIINDWETEHGAQAFAWENGATTQAREFLGTATTSPATTYTFAVMNEGTACKVSTDFAITQLAKPVVASLTYESPVCPEFEQTITIAEGTPEPTLPTGWTRNYSYSATGGTWSDLVTNSNQGTYTSGNAAGTNTAKGTIIYTQPTNVTGAAVQYAAYPAACQTSLQENIVVIAQPTITANSLSTLTCDETEFTVDLEITDASANVNYNYQFVSASGTTTEMPVPATPQSFSGNLASVTQAFEGLTSAEDLTYTFVVKSDVGCEASMTQTIETDPSLAFTVTTEPTLTAYCEGTIPTWTASQLTIVPTFPAHMTATTSNTTILVDVRKQGETDYSFRIASPVTDLSDVKLPLAGSFVAFRDFAESNYELIYTFTIGDCKLDPHTLSFTVNSLPVITSLTTGDPACEGKAFTLTAEVENATSYEWLQGTTSLSTALAATIPAPAALTTYTFTASNANCSVSETIDYQAVVNPVTSVSVADIPTPFCDNTTVILDGTVIADPTTTQKYTWHEVKREAADAASDVAALLPYDTKGIIEHLVQITPNDRVRYRLLVTTEGYNCPALQAVTNEAVVNPNFTFEVEQSDDTICEGGSVDIIVTVSNHDVTLPIKYRWLENGVYYNGAAWQQINAGSNVVSMTTHPSLHESESGPQSYEYSLEVKQDGHFADCRGYSEPANVSVLTDPNIVIEGPTNLPIGSNGTQTYTANVDGGHDMSLDYTYQWYINNRPIEGATSASVGLTSNNTFGLYGYANTHEVKVIATQSASGCQFEETLEVTIQEAATDDVHVEIAGPTSACAGDAVTLTAVLSDENLNHNFQWYKDGQLVGTNSITYSFVATEESDLTADYRVVVSREGCDDYASPFHYFQVLPATQITTSQEILCEEGKTRVTAESHNYSATLDYRWIWENEAGTLDTTYVNYRDYVNSATGTYEVAVEVLNSNCNATPVSFTVDAYVAPAITEVSSNEYSICDGGQITLTALTDFEGPGTLVYTWLENGIVIPNAVDSVINLSPRAIDQDTTHYYYSVYVTDETTGCESTTAAATEPVVVGRNPELAIEADMHICEGERIEAKVYFDGLFHTGFTPPADVRYRWFINGSLEPTLRPMDQQAYISAPVQYTGDPVRIDFEYIGQNGCASQAEPFFVTVHEQPIVNITSTEETICVGGEVTLTANLEDYNEDEMQIQWYTTDLSTPIEGATQLTHTTTLDETTEFFVKVYQRNSECVATDNFTVTVLPDPVITSVDVQNATICEGGEVTLTANANNIDNRGDVTYTWFLNGEVVPNAVGNVVVVSPLATDGDVTTYQYSVKVSTTLAGCESVVFTDATDVITVYANPTVEISGDAIVCSEGEDNVSLTANILNDSNLDLTYQWFENNTPISGATAVTYTTTKPYREYPYSFSVRIVNELGCTVMSETFEVFVGNEITVNALVSDATICEGGEVTFSASLNDWTETPLTYQWYKVDGGVETLIPGATELTYTKVFEAVGTYTYNVKIFNIQTGCEATGTATVEVLADPVITSVDVQNATICEGGEVTLTANANNIDNRGDVAYTWFLNGEVIPDAIDNILVVSPLATDGDVTTYQYSVKVQTTLTGCESTVFTDVNVVTVYANPTVEISGDAIVCSEAEDNVSLTANILNDSNLDLTYQWFENNTPISGATAVTYTTTKLYREYPYSFSVRVVNELGCTVMSESFEVFVGNEITVNALVSDATICEGGEVTFSASLNDWTETPLTYQWYKVDGGVETLIPGATELTYTKVFEAVGTYTYNVKIFNIQTGCEATGTATVEVLADPVITSVDVQNATICEGGEVTLTANANNIDNRGDVTYTWFLNGEVIPDAIDNILVVSPLATDGDVTTYQYSVKVQTTLTGCESTVFTDVNVVTVYANPIVEISGDAIVCSEATGNVVLTANILNDSNLGLTYQWFENNTPISGATAVTYTTTKPYREYAYSFSVRVMNELGCTVMSESFEVFVGDDITVNASVSEENICVGGEVTYAASLNDWNEAPLTYQWLDEDGDVIPGATELTYTTTFNTVGEYKYTVKIFNQQTQCDATGTATVNVFADPTAPTVVLSETTVCEGGEVTITAQHEDYPAVLGTATYTWYRNGILVEGVTGNTYTESPLATDGDATNYEYTVKVTLAAAGCESNVSEPATVTVFRNPIVAIDGDQSICEGTPVYLAAFVDHESDVVGDITYTWYQQGQLRLENSPNPFYTEFWAPRTEPYTFTVEITRGNGCRTMSPEFQVTVHEGVNVEVRAVEDVTTVCVGGSTTIAANINDYNMDLLTYQWFIETYDTVQVEVSAGNFVPDVDTIRTPIAGANRHFYVTPALEESVIYGVELYQTDSECFDANTIEVTVLDDPTIESITVSDNEICEGGQITLTANVINIEGRGDVTYTWFLNGEVIPNAVNAILNVSDLTVDGDVTVYNYSVKVTAAYPGCESEVVAAEPITVYANPTAVIYGDPIVCTAITATGNNVNLFADVESDLDVTYTWYVDGVEIAGQDDAILSIDKPYREYPYVFTLELSNEFGCNFVTAPYEVYVSDNIVVNTAVSENNICVGGTVTLAASVNNWNETPLTYQWLLNDVVIPGATGVTYTTTINEVGTYNYTVHIANLESLCQAISTVQTVTVHADPATPVITLTEEVVCEGGQVTLTATNYTNENLGEATYTWFRNGVVIEGATDATLVESYLAVDHDTTLYNYTVKVALAVSGCESVVSETETVTVHRNPVVVIEGDHHICQGENLRLKGYINGIFNSMPSTDNGERYVWYVDGERVERTNLLSPQTITYDDLEYTGDPIIFQFEYFGPNGCVAISEEYSVFVHNIVEVNVTSTDDVVCAGGEVTLTANLDDYNEDEYVIQWYKNDVRVQDEIAGATMLNFTTNVDETTNFRVTVNQRNTNCFDSASYQIAVLDVPEIKNVVLTNTAICEGGEVTVTAETLLQEGVDYGELTYTWYVNGVIIPGAVASEIVVSPVTIDGDVTTYVYSAKVEAEVVGCESEITVSSQTLTVSPNPVVTLDGDAIVCEGETITINASINGAQSTEEGSIVKWYMNDELIETPAVNPLTLVVNGLEYTGNPVSYRVEYANTNGCNAVSEPFVVIVNAGVVVSVTTSDAIVCEDGQVTLTANLEDYNEDNYVIQWYANNEPIVGATMLTLTTNVASETTYKVVVDQRNTECSDEAEITIETLATPVVNSITLSDNAICEGGEVTITAATNLTAEYGVATYTWYVNGEVIPAANDATLVVSPLTTDGDVTTYTYSAKVATSVTGCESTVTAATETLTVNPNPTAVIYGDPIVCTQDGNNITLTADVETALDLTYTWYVDGVEVEGQETAILNINKPYRDYPYAFTVELTNELGCNTVSEAFEVYVNNNIEVNTTITETTVCVGGTTTLAASLGNWNETSLTYQWLLNDQVIPGATELTYTPTFDAVGEYNFTVAITNLESLCQATSTVQTVNVYEIPAAPVVTVDVAEICEGGQVTVTATPELALAGLGEATYTWYRNNVLVEGVTTATLIDSPNAVDADVTTYTYTASVSYEATGCESAISDAATVVVFGNPIVLIDGDQSICAPERVSLTAMVNHETDVVGDITYTWYQQGQVRVVGSTPNYTETWEPREEPYVFTVEITRGNGCTTMSPEFLVYVHEEIVVNVTTEQATICEGGNATLVANLNDYNDELLTYQWFVETYETSTVEMGNIVIEVTDTVQTDIAGATQLTYTTSALNADTKYGIRVTQTHSGCEATDVTTITVTEAPVVNVVTAPTTDVICGGTQVAYAINTTIDGVVAADVTYQWFLNGILIPNATTSVYETILTEEGTYTYTVVATTPESGCESVTTLVDEITVTAQPTVDVVADASPVLCANATVTFTANVLPLPAEGTTYQWYVDNTIIDGAVTAEYTTEALEARETPYNYHVVVANTNTGCEVVSEPYAITILAQPVAVVTVDEPAICVGGEATFTVTVEGGVDNVNGIAPYTYQWSANGVEIAGATAATYTVTPELGTTNYSVTVTNEYGCEVTASYEGHTVVADPTATLAIVGETAVCEGGTTQVMATVEGGLGNTYTYTWRLNGNIIHVNTTPEATDVITTNALSLTTTNVYSVEVAMSGVACATDVVSITLDENVNPAPFIELAGEQTLCYGGTTTITSTITGGVEGATYTYQWFAAYESGLPQPINGANAATYATESNSIAGRYTYHVIATATNGSNCEVISGEVVVDVVADPTVLISGINQICEGTPAILTATVQGGVEGETYNYTWSYQQGTNTVEFPVSTENTFTLPADLAANLVSQPYLFSVAVEGTTVELACNTASATHAIQINAVPAVTLTVNNAAICQDGTAEVTATVTPAGVYNYTWTVAGDELAINQPVINVYDLASGPNVIEVAVQQNGATATCVANATTTVAVVNNPTVTISSTDDALCIGGMVNLEQATINTYGFNANDFTYTWNRNGFAVPNANQSSLVEHVLLPGTYVYTLSIAHENEDLGCASANSNPITIEALAQPTVTISTSLADICTGGTVEAQATLSGNNYGTVSYEWRRNNETVVGTSANLSDDLTGIGTYTYHVIATSNVENCQPAVSEASSVNVVAQPTWTQVAVNPNAICLGEEVTLTADIQGGVLDQNGSNENHIQWMRDAAAVNTLGGNAVDVPTAAGTYAYYPVYEGPIGSGCALPDAPQFDVVVNALPELTLSVEGDGVICGNDDASWATLVVEFANPGTYQFDLVSSTGTSTTITTSVSPYQIPVRPEVSTVYWLDNVSNTTTGCEAQAASSTVLVSVSNAQIAHANNLIEICGTETEGTVDIFFTVDYSDASTVEFMYLTDANYTEYPVSNYNDLSYITVTTPATPGDYAAMIRINGCEFEVTVRVLISSVSPGFEGLVELRWDDVLVVNNNPANNGGFTFTYFQWYKNGEPIPGANKQYYQEIGGIHAGDYTVYLIGKDANGNTVEFGTCDMTFLPQGVSVYPVPAHVSQPVVLEIDLTEEQLQGAYLDIFDARGALVKSQPITSVITRIEGFQAQGTYLGRVTTGTNEVKTVKFMIVK